MILNTGARTDTVQYFTKWLINRFREEYVLVRNPAFPKRVISYNLSPEYIDAVLFCSKNYEPILPYLSFILNRYRTYFYYTITAYEKDIEPGVPTIEKSINTLKKLSSIVGKKRVAWRYDPVFLLDKYNIEYHFKTFEMLAKELSPYIDRCIFSFVKVYKKLETSFPKLSGVALTDKIILARGLSDIAKRYGIILQTCGTLEDYKSLGINDSGCATPSFLGEANNCEFLDSNHKMIREGCRCIESHDIGAYDTCLNGCRYCYANSSHQRAIKNYQFHNPLSPLILGELKSDDIVTEGKQKSLLKFDSVQPTLF